MKKQDTLRNKNENNKKKPIRKKVKKLFKRDNIIKIVIIGATLALILTSILPYILL